MAATEDIPLPRGWTKTIRSSVLHAISVAFTALTRAWGLAATSRLRTTRLQAELDRGRTEIALLREEVAIKNDRLGRVRLAAVRTTASRTACESCNSRQHAAGRCPRQQRCSQSPRTPSRHGSSVSVRRPLPSGGRPRRVECRAGASGARYTSTGSRVAASAAAVFRVAAQFSGSSSSTRLAGCVATRTKTSAR